MASASGLIAEAKRIYRTGGLPQLAKRGVAFLRWRVFEHRRYYLYADPVDAGKASNEADFMPRVDGLAFRTVRSNEEADELEARGLEFRSCVTSFDARDALDKGAIAFCTFVGPELAAIDWLAMSQQAKDSLGEPPYHVDFSTGEACSGGLWTNPKHRGKGLRQYSILKKLEFMQQSGIHTRRAVSPRENIPLQKGRPSFMPQPCAEARYLRVLWWRSWKEKPLS